MIIEDLGDYVKIEYTLADYKAALTHQDFYRFGQDDMRCEIDKLYNILSNKGQMNEFKAALKDPKLLKKLTNEYNL